MRCLFRSRRRACRGRDAAPDSGTERHRRLLRRRPGAHAGRWVVIRIRAAGAEDVAAIARIHVETWRDTYAGLLPDHALLRMSAQRERVLWSRTVAAGESVLVPADSADGVVENGRAAGRERECQNV